MTPWATIWTMPRRWSGLRLAHRRKQRSAPALHPPLPAYQSQPTTRHPRAGARLAERPPMIVLIYLTLGAAAIGLVYAAWRAAWINRQDAGTERMQEIAGFVREGAMAFLRRQYSVLTLFVLFAG